MSSTSFRQLYVVDLGTMSYAEAWDLQKQVAQARITGEIEQDVLLLVEHPPVVTLGRSSKEAHLVASRELLAERGVELFDVERGGDVTYHGPGQLVGYPIIDLKRHRQDLHWYLRQLEEAIIRAVAPFGVSGWRHQRYTGVWTGEEGRPRKLASIGVHARDWVTWHGFALNVSTDVSAFDLIVPCGIRAVTMTSLAVELGDAAPSMAEVAEAIADGLAGVFDLEVIPMPQDGLRGAAAKRG